MKPEYNLAIRQALIIELAPEPQRQEPGDMPQVKQWRKAEAPELAQTLGSGMGQPLGQGLGTSPAPPKLLRGCTSRVNIGRIA